MKVKVEKKYFFLALGITFGLAVLSNIFFAAHFETNDDVFMANIAYGTCGTYSSRLVFINVIWGFAIKILMQIFPTVAWYSWLQYLTVSAAFAIILTMIFCRFGLYKSVIPVALFSYFFSYEYLCSVQFTKTAGLASAAGIALIMFAVEYDLNIIYALLGAGFVIIGALVRFSSLEMLLIPFFGVGIMQLLSFFQKGSKKKIIKLVLLFAFTLSVVFSLKLVDDYMYTEGDWKYYQEFNVLRAKLLDYGFPDYEKNKDLYESLDISEEDLVMYQNWDFSDPDVFDLDAVTKLVEAKEKTSLSFDTCITFFAQAIPKLFTNAYSFAFFFALIFCFSKNMPKKKRMLILYEILALLGVYFYLYFIGRYSENRVLVQLFLAFYLIELLFATDDLPVINKKAAVILCVFVLTVAGFFAENKKIEYCEATDAPYFTALNYFQENKQNLYLIGTTVLDSGSYHLWNNNTLNTESNMYYLGGWTTYMPTKLDVLKRYGLENPFRDATNKENVFFVVEANDGGWRIALYENYIREHYDQTAECVLVDNIAGTYDIYRVVTDN